MVVYKGPQPSIMARRAHSTHTIGWCTDDIINSDRICTCLLVTCRNHPAELNEVVTFSVTRMITYNDITKLQKCVIRELQYYTIVLQYMRGDDASCVVMFSLQRDRPTIAHGTQRNDENTFNIIILNGRAALNLAIYYGFPSL